MSALDALSDEDKIAYAIECIAVDTPIPENIKVFLREHGLYDMIVEPRR